MLRFRGRRTASERRRKARRWRVQRLPALGEHDDRPLYVAKAASAVSESLWTNADDRLPGASLGRVEGGDGIVEGRDVADVGPQSSVPHPLDDLTQLGTIGLH